MRAAKLSSVLILVAGTGMGSALGVAGCGSVPQQAEVGSPAATALRSQRRLAYKISGPVVIAQAPGAGVVPALDRSLRAEVRRDMRQLGLEVDGDPALGQDLVVHLSASVQPVGRLARARAALWVMADGRLLQQIDSVEVIEAPERIAGVLSRDLVERLARSPLPGAYADSLYGRRLRPLRDTVGGHAAGRDDNGGIPPIEALALADGRRGYQRTLRGRAELAPPAAAPDSVRAAASAELQKAQGLLAAGQAREAYAAFEQAYLLDGEAQPLFGMAESLLRAGAKQQAAIFYRAYLRRAQPGSPDAARANAQVSAAESSPETAR
jgi:hypothetical protein